MEAAIKSSIFSLVREKKNLRRLPRNYQSTRRQKKSLFFYCFFLLPSFVSQIPLAW